MKKLSNISNKSKRKFTNRDRDRHFHSTERNSQIYFIQFEVFFLNALTSLHSINGHFYTKAICDYTLQESGHRIRTCSTTRSFIFYHFLSCPKFTKLIVLHCIFVKYLQKLGYVNVTEKFILFQVFLFHFFNFLFFFSINNLNYQLN